LVTAKKAGAKLVEYVAASLRFGFGSIPNAIIVTKTAPQMLMNEAMLRYETFLSVRGRVKIQSTMNPTTPQTMLQVAFPVIAFIAIVNVRMCDPITASVSASLSTHHIQRTKDEEYGLRSATKFPSKRPPHDFQRIREVVDARIRRLVLAQYVTRVRRQQSHGDDENDPRHKPNSGKNRRQRQYT
jgi:hypothetical protein